MVMLGLTMYCPPTGQGIIQDGCFRCRADACHGVDIRLSIVGREILGANLGIVIEVGVEEVQVQFCIQPDYFDSLGYFSTKGQ